MTKNKIHIKKKNIGKFNATKKATGKTTEELTHSKNPITRKRAIFAQNASHWKKGEFGIEVDTPEFFPGDEGYYEPGGEGYMGGADNLYNSPRFSSPMFQPLKKQKIGVPEIKQAPNFKQTIETPQIHSYDFYDPQTGNINQPQNNNTKFSEVAPYIPTNSIFNNYYLNKGNQYRKKAINSFSKLEDGGFGGGDYWNLASGIANAVTADINTAKGFTDIAGTFKTNAAIKQIEAQNKRQNLFSQYENPTPTFQNSWGGNNPLDNGYIPVGENGMSIKQIGGKGMPNVEVEGSEHIQLPNGFSEEIQGASHAEGGIPLNLEIGSKILSEKLKHPETGKSYAKMAKKFQTKKDFKNLESKFSDKINKETANLNIDLKNVELDNLFMEQEKNKILGKHGAKIKESTLEDYTMKYGGIKKMQGGGTNWGQDGTWIKKILDFESKQGSASGTGLKNYGIQIDKWGKKYPYLADGVTEEEAIKFIQSEYLPQVSGYPEEVQKRLVDYAYNTGRNPNDLLLKATGNIDLKTIQEKPSDPNLWNSKKQSILEQMKSPDFITQLDNAKKEVLQDTWKRKGNPEAFTKTALPRINMWNTNEDVININNNPNSVNKSNNQPLIETNKQSFTGINPNVDFKTLRLKESEKQRRNKFLPYEPNEIPTGYGSQLGLESVFNDFENQYGVKLPTGTNEQKLQALREYQTKLTPQLTKDYKLNFARGNKELYQEYTKSKGYKANKDKEKESQNFYDWAKNSGKLTEDYANKGLWGHEYYNIAPLDFSTEAEFNKFTQDPDWAKVGNYYVDRSANPTDPITYYSINKKYGKPSTVSKASDVPSTIDKITPVEGQKSKKGYSPIVAGLQFSDAYLRDPITVNNLNPEFYQPTTISPYLNDIQRLQYASNANLGTSGAELATRANLFGQGLTEYGKRYYDASTYNAQAKTQAARDNANVKEQVNQFNLSNYIQNARNPQLQREAVITEQKRLDRDAQLKTFAEKEHEQAVRNYLGDIYNPQYALNENFNNPYNLKSAETESEEAKKARAYETLYGKKKYGGKVKIKTKKKK